MNYVVKYKRDLKFVVVINHYKGGESLKRFVAFVLALLLLCVPVFADGDEFEELNIFVDILENGDALITEEWNVVNGEYGTEWYKPMTNMNHMDIKDFKVLFNGEPGEDMGKDWDTDLNFKKKAYKFGINKIGFKQYELFLGSRNAVR